MYFEEFNKTLKEILGKYLVTDFDDLKDKVILRLKDECLFFTDGTFCALYVDDGELFIFNVESFISCYGISYASGYSDVWETIKQFLKEFHPKDLEALEDIYNKENIEVVKAREKSAKESALRYLKTYQEKYPELNITFNNETDNNH